jgi:hypothetical protein
MFTSIKNYLVTVGLPASNLLSQHAVEHHHEDVPDVVAKEAEGTCSLSLSSRLASTANLEMTSGGLGRRPRSCLKQLYML